MVWGSPIRTRPDFDIAAVLKHLNEEKMAREDRGEESEDERELEGDALAAPFSPPFTPPNKYSSLPDTAPSLSPLTPLPASPALDIPPSLTPSSETSAPPSRNPNPPAAHTAASSLAPSESVPTKRTRKQQHVKDLRARKRAAKQQVEDRSLKCVTLKRRENMEALQVDKDTVDLNVASTGWIGGRIPNDDSSFTLDDVTKAPYHLHHVKWDGK
jgi:hypothetical protein